MKIRFKNFVPEKLFFYGSSFKYIFKSVFGIIRNENYTTEVVVRTSII